MGAKKKRSKQAGKAAAAEAGEAQAQDLLGDEGEEAMKPLPRFTIVERPGRMQPFTVYGGDQIWFFTTTHEEATAYIERQIRGFA